MCEPIGVFCRIRLYLLSLGLWDLAINLEGDAVGAGNAEARGIASDLVSGKQLHPRYRQRQRNMQAIFIRKSSRLAAHNGEGIGGIHGILYLSGMACLWIAE